MGGPVITLNYMNKTRCVAADGDWRAFVTRHLPEMELEGVESPNTFKSTQRGDEASGSSRLQDVNM